MVGGAIHEKGNLLKRRLPFCLVAIVKTEINNFGFFSARNETGLYINKESHPVSITKILHQRACIDEMLRI